uniref:UvrD-like helicase ATP-binding domain-containing protein n=1 Tax=Macrostomum lignano TaxID=282301 RepID=A0A1I8IKN9_9PLAT
GRIYCDVLRLWAIVESSEALAEEITRAITAHKRGAACALARELNSAAAAASALARDNAANAGRILPRTYSVVSGGGGGGSSDLVRFQPPGASKETEYHMMKFYSWDASLIADILTGEARIDLPFRVTEQEHAIIELSSESPVLLIGRSGTGKTTCCVFRMFSEFSDYWRQVRSEANPIIPRRRLYRLVDPDAADDGAQSDEDADAADDAGDAAGGEADQRHRGRHRGRVRNRNRTTNSDATDTYEEEAAAVASSAVDVGSDNEDAPEPQFDHLRQLFVTKNPVLCREVRKNFYDLCAGLRDAELPEPEFELPNRLQVANSGHFPMFVSSKQLWMLLDASLPGQPFFQRNEDGSLAKKVPGWEDEEADIEFLLDSTADDLFDAANYYDDGNADGGGVEGGADVAGAGGANADQQNPAPQQLEDRRREVTYELFSTSLWEKLPSKLRSGLQPSLVWTELVSFIKGSVEALNSPGGFLSLAKYRELGKKRAPEFADSRERVYRLFEEYQRLLRDLGLFDMNDLVACLYRRQTVWLAESAAPSPEEDWALHAIFVDETQDFTQAELSLLLRCCQDPNRMFFTGDTAQSIMRGVSFRFTDLKTLFHHARRGLQSQGATGALRMPDGLQVLTHNYRSHSGILGLASCVILLLGRLFPSTFDPLEPDMGLFPGPKPVLIESCSATDLAFLLQGARRKSNAHIDFGAHQAIIVASDEARRYLVENVPELSIALVLTVYESKGLEFDDVLLYNFFKDSPASEKV